MPMDKLTRQIQKNNMWVRRRNTTADRSLQSTLRHIESGYYRNYKQYLRDKIRTESELRDLADKPTEPRPGTAIDDNITFDLNGQESVKHEGPNLHSHSNTSTWSYRKAITSPVALEDIDINSDFISKTKNSSIEDRTDASVIASNIETSQEGERTKGSSTVSKDRRPKKISSKERSASSLSRISSIYRDPETDRPETSNQKTSCAAHPVTSTPQFPLSRSHTFADSEGGKTSDVSNHHSNASCRYNVCFSPRYICEHFPCTTPATYHTLGFRRNDLGPWSTKRSHDSEQNGIHKRGLDTSNTCNSGISKTQQVHPAFERHREKFRIVNFSASSSGSRSNARLKLPINIQNEQSNDEDTFVIRIQRRDKKEEFQRSFDGPAFAPKPTDPILEHVREGSNKPLEVIGRSSARVTVKDKLRGLNYLINEMRMRNEDVKPRDWAINYGERVPMRILLNPVVPVNV